MNDYPQVVMVIRGTFSITNYREYGLKYLNERGIRVAVWLVGNIKKIGDCYARECNECVVRKFRSLFRYEKEVRRVKTYSLFYFPTTNVDSQLLAAVSKNNCKYIIQGRRSETPQSKMTEEDFAEQEPVEGIQAVREWLSRIKTEGKDYPIRKIADILNCIYIRRNKSVSIDYHLPEAVFCTNNLALDRDIESGKTWLQKCSIVFTPSTQYDYYIEEENKENHKTEECILFILAGKGFYYEADRAGFYKDDIYIPEVNRRYMENLNTLFRRMEDHYGIPVKIAAHPRVYYKKNAFEGREVFFGKTHELVKKCKISISTISYALSFPILFNKQILFYYNESFKKSKDWNAYYIPVFRELGLRGINLDNSDELAEPWKYVETVDENVRAEYIQKYHNVLQPGDRLYGEILEDYIREHGLFE